MKLFLVLALSAIIVLIVVQYMTYRNTKSTEQHSYKVLEEFENFEVRNYEPAMFSYVVMSRANYSSNASSGFRKLAGYIFGGNSTNESIAMTTPVTMTLESSMKMKFMVPNNMDQAELPKPNNPEIQFEKQEAKTMAAIRFNGWANDKKIQQYTDKLRKLLEENQIPYSGTFNYLGYNPPYQLIMRRNEIVVEVQYR